MKCTPAHVISTMPPQK